MPVQAPKIRKYSDKADAFLALRQYIHMSITFLQQEFEKQLLDGSALVIPLHIVIAVSNRLNRLLVTIPDLEYNHQTGSCRRLQLMNPIRHYFDALNNHIDELFALKDKTKHHILQNIISSVEITWYVVMSSYDSILEYSPYSCTERIAFGRDIGDNGYYQLLKIQPHEHLPQPSPQGYIANYTGDLALNLEKYTRHMMHCPAPPGIKVAPKMKTTSDEDIGFGLFD